MKHILPFFFLFLLALPQMASAHAVADETAIYQVTFTSTWNATSHPHPQDNFPANAHWSPLIGAIHNNNISFWAAGALASAGIEQMAETGGTTALRSEISAAGADAYATVQGSGLGTASGLVVLAPFTVTKDFPLVTFVTMIAPSPDWFAGVHDLALLDSNGNWRDEVVVTLEPYDAGSDDGTDYAAADVEASPHQAIANYTGVAPFANATLGTFTFTRQPRSTAQHLLYLPLIHQRGTGTIPNR